MWKLIKIAKNTINEKLDADNQQNRKIYTTFFIILENNILEKTYKKLSHTHIK